MIDRHEAETRVRAGISALQRGDAGEALTAMFEATTDYGFPAEQ